MDTTAMPTVRTTLNDQENKVQYHVMAYRELNKAELIFAVRTYLGTKGRKKQKRGTEVTIVTVIGL